MVFEITIPTLKPIGVADIENCCLTLKPLDALVAKAKPKPKLKGAGKGKHAPTEPEEKDSLASMFGPAAAYANALKSVGKEIKKKTKDSTGTKNDDAEKTKKFAAHLLS